MKRFSYSMILAAAVSLCSLSVADATTLDLSGEVYETQVAIDEALSHQGDLTSLTMHEFNFNNEGVDQLDLILSGSFPELKKFHIEHSTLKAHPTQLKSLTESFFTVSKEFAPKLEKLSFVGLRGCSNLVISGLDNLPCLNSLDINGCGDVNSIKLKQLLNSNHSSSLENLRLIGDGGVNLQGIPFSTFAPNLKSLSIKRHTNRLFSASHFKIACLPYLETLSLHSCGYVIIDFLPSLKELVIEDVYKPIDFSNFPRLEKLSVSFWGQNSLNLCDLKDLQSLQSLYLCYEGKYCEENNANIWGYHRSQMQRVILSSLEELSIFGADLRGAPIPSFAPNLKRFSLIDAKNISDSDIAQLANLRNLQNLDLRSPHLDHDIIEKLESLRTLEGLSLDFADMRLAQFDRLPKSLTSLSLDQSRLSPESFESLLSLKQLKRLVITDIDGPITPAMVDALQNALPNCEIVR